MSLKKRKSLDPEIKDIKVNTSAQYSKCRAQVTFDVSDGNGGRTDLRVEYPVQDDRHLTMLMEEKVDDGNAKRSIDHSDIKELSDVVKDALDKKE